MAAAPQGPGPGDRPWQLLQLLGAEGALQGFPGLALVGQISMEGRRLTQQKLTSASRCRAVREQPARS